jgi:hypothetical protein
MDDALIDAESIEGESVRGANGDCTFDDGNIDLEEQGDRGNVDHVGNP